MGFIQGVVKLFGAAITTPQVATFLAAQPTHLVVEQSDGDQYVVSREGGFDLLFAESPFAPRRHPQYRLLTSVFLYSSGADKHKEFGGELPFGFSFGDRRHSLIGRRQPDRTWVIGRGRVPFTHVNPSSDSWHTELFNLHVEYRDDWRIHHFQVTPPAPFMEEMARPTWEELALVPSQKLAAIQLYQKECKVNVVEAKRAIEKYVSEQRRT